MPHHIPPSDGRPDTNRESDDPDMELSQSETALELTSDVDLDNVEAPGSYFPRKRLFPGPGLPESLAWTLGVFIAHLGASIALLILLVAIMLISGHSEESLLGQDGLQSSYLVLLVGGDQFLVLLLSVLAAGFRFRGRLANCLNLRLPHPLHVCLIVGLMLPLSALSGELYRWTAMGWSRLVSWLPLLGVFDQANTVEWLQDMADAAPLPVMLLIIAVAPALGEELVFRGVIGRGLVARWGLWAGVAISSVLFAAVHLHPVHAIAVVPLGIAMHLVYLATRSFWAPVLLHLMNNAWATVMTRWGSEGTATIMDPEMGPGAGLLVASVIAVIVLGAVLYRTRSRYLLPDGAEWTPGYITTEVPPESSGASIHHGLWNRRALVTAATAWISFAVAFVAEIAAFAR